MPDHPNKRFPMFPADPLQADDPRLSGRSVQTFGGWTPGAVGEAGFIDPYQTEIALGRFGDGECPPLWWTVQVHAVDFLRTLPAPGTKSTDVGQILRDGRRASKMKARVNWQDRSGGGRNSGNTLDVDIAAGVTLQIGPTQRLDVSILAPLGTQPVQGRNQGPPIPAGLFFSIDSLVSVSAAAYPYPSGMRHARLSHAVIAGVNLNAFVPIPPGAVSATVYQTAVGTRTTPTLQTNATGTVGLGQGFGDPVDAIGTRSWLFPDLSGQACHIATGAAPDARTYSIVYRLEY